MLDTEHEQEQQESMTDFKQRYISELQERKRLLEPKHLEYMETVAMLEQITGGPMTAMAPKRRGRPRKDELG